jgi:hypothetical protein
LNPVLRHLRLQPHLPISTFRPTRQVTKLDDRTENITFALRVAKVEKFDIAIADRVPEGLLRGCALKITLKSRILFALAHGGVARYGVCGSKTPGRVPVIADQS